MKEVLNRTNLEYALRVAVFGEFLGHGVLAIYGKKQWVGWVEQLLRVDTPLATQLLLLVGVADVTVAIWTLLKPNKVVLLWAAFWGFFTALLRPLVGEPIWDFVERWANWGSPLALIYLLLNRK